MVLALCTIYIVLALCTFYSAWHSAYSSMMTSWSCVLLLCCITTSSCNCGVDIATCNAETWEDLFLILENALLSNGSNIYKLREILLKDPPELINITYHLQIINKTGSNLTQLPNNASNATVNQNPTTGTVVLRYGWTSIGIYSFIHPALLNQLQIQLPFFIIRNFVNNNHPFLWNGNNQLPSIHLQLSVPITGPCLPNNNMLDGVIKRLTSLVRKSLILISCIN